MPLEDAVVEVAIDFRLPPAAVRQWHWADFLAVQRAYGRRNKEAANATSSA